jgi:hypothetical protein
VKIQERSYSSKVIRPKPIIRHEDDGSLIVIATSWGQADHGERAVEEVFKYVNAAKADVEVTSPFEFLSCLPDEVNYVRTAMHIANDMLYRGENRKEYVSGVEILALFQRGPMIAWAHVGAPSILVQRQGQSLQPLAIGLDHSSEVHAGRDLQPPLPSQLLGLDPTCDIHCGHTYVKPGDQLVLLASSFVANTLWARRSGNVGLMEVTNSMIQESPEAPFWLGIIDIE